MDNVYTLRTLEHASDELARIVFDRLLSRFGPQNWWPGDSPFEVMVGAVLVQGTSWRNVEQAIENLRRADVLHPSGIRELKRSRLETLIHPAGYFRVKAGRLRNLVDYVFFRHEGSLDAMFRTDLDILRRELLGVHGIGPETADAILLYAGELPTFVVDTYTKRVLKRHGWIDPRASYDDVRGFFMSRIERDVSLYNEYHALLVRLGIQHCRKTPDCAACPLVDLLPDGKPLNID
jgi:endonuclease-3 related protein